RGLVSDEELSSFVLSNVPPRPWPMGNEHSLWLILDVKGDGFIFPLVPQPRGETLDGLELRIRTTLERWLIESRSARAWAAADSLNQGLTLPAGRRPFPKGTR